VGWLKRSTLERQSLAGKTVVILGGGGVAFDCAFTARRLNADAVHIVCLEPTDAMRAPAEEVQQALDEGIVIQQPPQPRRRPGRRTPPLRGPARNLVLI